MEGAVRRRLGDRVSWLRGLPLLPILVLFVLNAVDEFDRAAFAILAPEIKRAFHLSNTGFGILVSVAVLVVLAGALPIGVLGDRVRRTRLVWLGAFSWAGMAALTGFAPTVLVLVVARIGAGVGKLVNDPVHTSLISDYYPREVQGRAFAFHRMANPVGNILGPILAGGLAAIVGWRPTFLLVALPTLGVAVVATRLREPLRGESESRQLAEEAAKEGTIPYSRARRWLFGIPTVKRFYLATFFAGGGVVAILPFLAIFLEQVFALGTFARGVIAAAGGAALLVGTLAGGVLADRLRGRDLGTLARVAGAAITSYGVGLFFFGISATVPVAVVFSLLANFCLGLYVAPNLTVLASVMPARVRSTGLAMAAACLGLGALVFAPFVGRVADSQGIRLALAEFTPFMVLAGLVYLSGAKFVRGDAERALRALSTEVELRRQRLEAGRQALLVCRGLDVSYGQVQVLFGVDFEVAEGELVALLGTNGAGKSTLLKTISGLVQASNGAVFFQGRNITYHGGDETSAMGIIQVPGGKGVFPSLTVAENIEVAKWLCRKDPEHVRRATEEALSFFPVLRDRWDELGGNLSGGEQQMLTLAQAFIARPKLLMIDELSMGLAPTVIEQLLRVVREIHGRGTAVVLVEQSVNIALTLAHRAVFLEKGEVRFEGPTQDLLRRPDVLRSVFLEGAASVLGSDSGGRLDGRPQRVAVRERRELMSDDGGAPIALEVVDVYRRFGRVAAVNGVSFSLRRGQILGMIGPNGAGKTTVFDLISGFLVPDSGRVRLLGGDITGWPADARGRARLGRSFQDARLFPSLTVDETIAVALERHLEIRDPVSIALGLPGVSRSERRATRRVAELVDLMGLGAFRDKFVAELSTGTRRIVDITCALAHDPAVLLLDEPSSGIAQRETEALGPVLLHIRDELDCSLLVIEHDMPLITSVADELVALEVGAVIAAGLPSEVVKHPAVVASYLGTDEAALARSGPTRPRRAARGGGRLPRPQRRPAPLRAPGDGG